MDADKESMQRTINEQQIVIERMAKEIADLKAMFDSMRKNSTIAQREIIMPSRLPYSPTPSIISSFKQSDTNTEYATDEEDLEKELVKPKQVKRRRTKTKSPTKNNNSPASIPKKIVDNRNTDGKKETKIPLPPPIYASNVEDFNTFRKKIINVIQETVQFKALSNSNIKISVVNTDDYRKIKKLIENIKSEQKNKELELQKIDPKATVKIIEYHTYQLKEERTFRFIIRGLPCTIDPDEIKLELEKLNHEVKHITNIFKSVIINGIKVKKEFPLFAIELLQKENNKEVFNITNLVNCKVSIETPRKVRDIPQCTNCQQLGHTKSFCNRAPRCVKCALNHHYKDCNKQKDSEPTCVLCQEKGHTANYKGCPVYQAKIKSQKLNKTTVVQRLQTKTTKPLQSSVEDLQKAGMSYAQVTKINTEKQINKINANDNTNNSLTNNKEILSMLQQIQNTLNQLTNRVNNLESKTKPLQSKSQKNNKQTKKKWITHYYE